MFHIRGFISNKKNTTAQSCETTQLQAIYNEKKMKFDGLTYTCTKCHFPYSKKTYYKGIRLLKLDYDLSLYIFTFLKRSEAKTKSFKF